MRVFAVDFAFSPFVAEWALVATWSNVTYYNKHGIPFDGRVSSMFISYSEKKNKYFCSILL